MTTDGNSLEAWVGDRMVFSSKGHWLMPMLELEDFLKGSGIDPRSILLKDTKAGRAAAGLAIRLGIRTVEIGLVSEYALRLYERHKVRVSYGRKVPFIECLTEKLITEDITVEQIYALVRQRID